MSANITIRSLSNKGFEYDFMNWNNTAFYWTTVAPKINTVISVV